MSSEVGCGEPGSQTAKCCEMTGREGRAGREGSFRMLVGFKRRGRFRQDFPESVFIIRGTCSTTGKRLAETEEGSEEFAGFRATWGLFPGTRTLLVDADAEGCIGRGKGQGKREPRNGTVAYMHPIYPALWGYRTLLWALWGSPGMRHTLSRKENVFQIASSSLVVFGVHLQGCHPACPSLSNAVKQTSVPQRTLGYPKPYTLNPKP